MVRRLTLLYSLCVIYLLIILIRLFILQVTSADYLGNLGEKQRLDQTIIPAARGRILSSDGTPLVINQNASGIIIEPQKLKDKAYTMGILAKWLKIPEASISAKLSNTSLKWVPLAHKVEENIITRIKAEELPGLVFLEESKRFYPEGSMAAQLLGFVGSNLKGEDQGYFGLEGFYDEQLRGRNGVLYQETDANGNPILTGNRDMVPAENGRELTLYIDKSIQFIVEKNLKKSVEKYGAKGGSVIMMDPKTGGIMAMASYPSYDPNEYTKYPVEYYKNPTVSLSFEPGSTFKVVVMASAINEGKLTPDTIFNESGPLEIGGYTINTWNQKYHGNIDQTQVLEYSSNVGMVFVVNKLGKDKLFDYLDKFGFGQSTHIDLQDEAVPALRPKNKWYEIDYATASFGQGIAVTPLQMVRAVGAIANDGKLMVPAMVKKIKLPTGEIIEIKPKMEKEILKPEVARTIAEMMALAVDNGETRMVKPSGYRIAGKTGTAQISIAGHYDAEKTVASFIGFAPVESPKFVMMTTLREPSVSIWGSETAAPLFFNIAKEIFSYLKISPSS